MTTKKANVNPSHTPPISEAKTTSRSTVFAPESDGSAQSGVKIPSKQKHRFRSAKEWQELGVEVKRLSGELPIDDRETSMSFLGRDKYAEVTSARRDWQRRLEGLGCVPTAINTFQRGAAEVRYYSKVPRRFIRMPSAGRKNAETAR